MTIDPHDWRMFKRERCDGTVDVSMSVIISNVFERKAHSARIVDISRGGIGIISDVPLELGFVRVNPAHENRAGIVMWNRRIDDNTYRVGIRYDNVFSMNGKPAD